MDATHDASELWTLVFPLLYINPVASCCPSMVEDTNVKFTAPLAMDMVHMVVSFPLESQRFWAPKKCETSRRSVSNTFDSLRCVLFASLQPRRSWEVLRGWNHLLTSDRNAMKRYPRMKAFFGPWFDLYWYYFHDRKNDVTRWDVRLESAQLYFTKMWRHGDPTHGTVGGCGPQNFRSLDRFLFFVLPCWMYFSHTNHMFSTEVQAPTRAAFLCHSTCAQNQGVVLGSYIAYNSLVF